MGRFDYTCKKCGRGISTDILPSNGICQDCRDTPSEILNKMTPNHLVENWKNEDYRVYVIQQMALYYAGMQSASKTAEILHITIQDVWELAKKLDELFKEGEE